MDTLKYIKNKFSLRYLVPMPIVLPIDRLRGLTSLFNELGFKIGVEIGTSKGMYAKWLLHKVKDLKLYCVDPWKVYDACVEMHEKEGQKVWDGFYEETKKRLEGMNVEIIRKFSMDGVKDFVDNSLDFVYLDGNHTFEFVINDIAEWSKKVRPGGIISGHDFWNSIDRKKLYKIGLRREEPTDPIERMKLCQVEDAVKAWTHTNRIKPWFITLENNQSSGGASWFWIKQ